ncbi:MAG: MmcQ/YjbR family DNA-binding protein [Candidatus Ornithospirochaeta sp.]
MDLSYILPSSFDISSLPSFSEENGLWKAKFPLEEDDLFVVYTYREGKMEADVEDGEGEKYALFSLPSPGAFVSKLREEAESILSGLLYPLLSLSSPERDRVISLFGEKYGIKPETPWSDDEESMVFRSPSCGKWIALMMRIPSSRLGIPGEEKVCAVNLKHDEKAIPALIDRKFVFPAWHMSKKTWITVLLSPSLDWDFFSSLIERSRELVERKQKNSPHSCGPDKAFSRSEEELECNV